jgi:hypothetical protein
MPGAGKRDRTRLADTGAGSRDNCNGHTFSLKVGLNQDNPGRAITVGRRLRPPVQPASTEHLRATVLADLAESLAGSPDYYAEGLVSTGNFSQSNRSNTLTTGELIKPGKYPRTRTASTGCAILFAIAAIEKNRNRNRANR